MGLRVIKAFLSPGRRNYSWRGFRGRQKLTSLYFLELFAMNMVEYALQANWGADEKAGSIDWKNEGEAGSIDESS